MYKVVLYYDESYFDFDFKSYKRACDFLNAKLSEDNDILIGKILKDEDTIKVVSNIGYYDEANKIIYGYYHGR